MRQDKTMEPHRTAMILILGAIMMAGCSSLGAGPCVPFTENDFTAPVPSDLGPGQIHMAGECVDGKIGATDKSTRIDATAERIDQLYIESDGIRYPVLDDSVLRYYDFDSVSSQGATMNASVDSGPKGAHAEFKRGVKEVAYEAGKGSGLRFDGINSAVYSGYPDYYTSGEFTAEMWIKPLSTKNQMLAISGSGWQSDGFYVNVYDGRYYFTIPNSKGGWQAYTKRNIEIGKWVHLAVTAKKGSQMKIYLNGERANIFTSVPNAIFEPSNHLTLGYYPNQPFSGDMDSFALYNRSFSDDEIRWHYRTMLERDGENRWSLGGGQRWLLRIR